MERDRGFIARRTEQLLRDNEIAKALDPHQTNQDPPLEERQKTFLKAIMGKRKNHLEPPDDPK